MATDFVASCLFFLPGRHSPRLIFVEDTEREPGVIKLPGGSFRENETPIETATREWVEEVGDVEGTFEIEPILIGKLRHKAIPQSREGRSFLRYFFWIRWREKPRQLFKIKNRKRTRDFRELPCFASANHPKVKSSHRVFLALLLPIFGHRVPDLIKQETQEFEMLRSKLGIEN